MGETLDARNFSSASTSSFLPEHLPVFVYGTLRVGGSNHFLLAGKDKDQEAATLENAVLVDNGHYPYLLDAPEILAELDGDCQAVGALLRIEAADWEQVIATLDELEGCSPAHPVDDRNLYNRVKREVSTTLGKRDLAWVYIPPTTHQTELVANYPLIRSGDWMNRA